MTGERPEVAVTFDDVLLKPRYSDILPSEVSVESKFSRNIEVNIPLASAAMDTVTEHALAIAIAQEGGIGVIHRNITPEEQADEVRKVKRSESGMIVDPITLPPDRPIADALAIMAEYRISGVPITDGGKLVGILTNRDLRFEQNVKRLIHEVMTPAPLITAPEGTSLEKAKEILQKNKIEKLPVVDDAGNLVGLITYKDIMKAIKYPSASKDAMGRLRVSAAVGVGDEQVVRADALVDAGVDALVIDTAHGYTKAVIETTRKMVKEFPDVDIVAGNVAGADGCRALIDAGADGVKVGVGPGSTCTTRVVSGAGVPQVTAIEAAAEAAHVNDVPIIADGGVKYSGDIVKALAAGASTVMIGSLFAGTEESPGESILYEGRSYKVYRGMGSVGAMRSGRSRDRYFRSPETETGKLVPEGIEGRVPYRGPLSSVVYQLIGGVRSGMGYVGAKDIPTLWDTAEFIRVSSAGLVESHPHDIEITKEAPNYEIRGPKK
ncbi:MAG: IMP dehydrogenase [Candidatus Coatesbacteria bacterium]|nr:MAG: IMP dehydrogenase [Candidatus Coatesbacteria bacterium]